MAFAAARMILKDKNRRKSKEDVPATHARTRSKVHSTILQHFPLTTFHDSFTAVYDILLQFAAPCNAIY